MSSVGMKVRSLALHKQSLDPGQKVVHGRAQLANIHSASVTESNPAEECMIKRQTLMTDIDWTGWRPKSRQHDSSSHCTAALFETC